MQLASRLIEVLIELSGGPERKRLLAGLHVTKQGAAADQATWSQTGV